MLQNTFINRVDVFLVPIDELVKDDSDVLVEPLKARKLIKQLDINHTKHFDIKLCDCTELTILPCPEEKVVVDETLTAEEQAYIEEIREQEPEEFDAVEEILEEAKEAPLLADEVFDLDKNNDTKED